MTQPHHFVFNELDSVIRKSAKIEHLLPLLVKRKVISDSLQQQCRVAGKQGMKFLTSYLRNKDFDTFITFLECIQEAADEHPGEVKVTVLENIHEAVKHFDKRSQGGVQTNYADRIPGVKKKSVTQPETSEPASVLQSTVQSPQMTDAITAAKESMLQLETRQLFMILNIAVVSISH